MATSEALTIFLSEFDLQVSQIEKSYTLLEKKRAKSENEFLSIELVESIGYWLHNLYSAYEELFQLIAAFWENSLDNASAYHIQLLKRMRIEIPGVRPAVMKSEESFVSLDELRAFRHVFRHAYSYGLDDERVFFLLRRVLKSKDLILGEIGAFRQDMEKLAASD